MNANTRNVLSLSKFLLLIFGLIWFENAFSVNLGSLQINSYLDQPLQAEIKIQDLGEVKLETLSPELASVEDYSKSGLEMPANLPELIFKISKDEKNQGIIKISSTAPIRSPIIALLLQINTPAGKELHDYTLLLDPSTESKKSPDHIFTAAKKTISFYGPTLKNESLSQIIKKIKLSGKFTSSQLAVAILNKNPDAFVNGDVNLLLPGHQLQLPTTHEIHAVNPQEAYNQIITKRSNLANSQQNFHSKIILADNSDKNEIQSDASPISFDQTKNISEQQVMIAANSLKKAQEDDQQNISEMPPVSPVTVESKVTEEKQFKNLDNENKNQLLNQALNDMPYANLDKVSLQQKLAVADAGLLQLQKERQLLLMQLQDMKQQNQLLSQQLSQREAMLIDLQTKIAKLREGLINLAPQTSPSMALRTSKPIQPIIKKVIHLNKSNVDFKADKIIQQEKSSWFNWLIILMVIFALTGIVVLYKIKIRNFIKSAVI